MRILDKIFKADRTPEEVIEILKSILSRTISDAQWDDFISVKIVDPKLEKVRLAVEEMWTLNSPYRLPDSIDPVDINPKGVSRLLELISSIEV